MAPPDTPPEQATAQKKALLAERVRMEALAQRAQAENLDAGPTYEAELVFARRRILASLVERTAAADAPEVTPAQVRMVIESNPQAFRDRQFLTIEELTLPLPGEPLRKQLVDASEQGASFQSMEERLEQAQVKPLRRVYTVGSEQVKAELLQLLMAAKAGEAVMVRRGSEQLQIMVLRTATPAPLMDEAATMAATAVLNARLRQQAVQQKVHQVLSDTAIAYFGEYATAAVSAPSAGEQAPDAAPDRAPDFAAANAGATNGLPQALARPDPLARWRQPALAGLFATAASLALLLWVMVVRLWVGSLWLPVVWPWGQRARTSSPRLAVLLARHVLRRSTERFQVKTWLTRCLQMAPALAAVMMLWLALPTGVDRLGPWVAAGCAAAGCALGLLGAHAFAHSRWRTATRKRLWLPPLLVALALALVSRAALVIG